MAIGVLGLGAGFSFSPFSPAVLWVLVPKSPAPSALQSGRLEALAPGTP
jgi:hypothetical protein